MLVQISATQFILNVFSFPDSSDICDMSAISGKEGELACPLFSFNNRNQYID